MNALFELPDAFIQLFPHFLTGRCVMSRPCSRRHSAMEGITCFSCRVSSKAVEVRQLAREIATLDQRVAFLSRRHCLSLA